MPVRLLPPAHPIRSVLQRQAGAAARRAVPPPPTRFAPAPARPVFQAKAPPRPANPVVQPMRARGFHRPGVVQKFPFTIEHRTAREMGRIVARWANPDIELYRHGVHLGLLKIDVRGTVWGLKDILIDGSLRGRDLGTLLIYLFAELAVKNGATALEVQMPNGTGVYQRAGFTVTAGATPHHPATITGVPATVRDRARGIALAQYRLTAGEPPIAAPSPVPRAADVRRPLINNNRYGNPLIGDAELD